MHRRPRMIKPARAAGAAAVDEFDSDEEFDLDAESEKRDAGAAARGAGEGARGEGADDSLVRLVMDRSIIDVISTLVAKLERVRYDDARAGVFRTAWCRELFAECLGRMCPGEGEGFDADAWYRGCISSSGDEGPDVRFAPTLTSQSVNTNWMSELLKLEQRMPGFMSLLHNTMDLEDKTHKKLGAIAKEDTEYDYFGAGPRNPALFAPALLGASAEAKRIAAPPPS